MPTIPPKKTKSSKPNTAKKPTKKKPQARVVATKKALISELRANLFHVTDACEKVGVNRAVYYSYLKDDSQFSEEIKNIQEEVTDWVESKFYALIEEGDSKSIIFYLKSKAKARGYVERQEIEHKGGINIYFPVDINEGD